MACTASPLSARGKLWCKSLQKLILEKKEMKYCLGFVMTKLLLRITQTCLTASS